MPSPTVITSTQKTRKSVLSHRRPQGRVGQADRCSCRSRRSRSWSGRADCSTGTRTTASSPAARSSTGTGRSTEGATQRQGVDAAPAASARAAADGGAVAVVVLAISRCSRLEVSDRRASRPPARDWLSSLGVAGLLHRPLGRPLRGLERLRRPSPARPAPRRPAGRPCVPMPWNSGIATYWMPI